MPSLLRKHPLFLIHRITHKAKADIHQANTYLGLIDLKRALSPIKLPAHGLVFG